MIIICFEIILCFNFFRDLTPYGSSWSNNYQENVRNLFMSVSALKLILFEVRNFFNYS